MTPSGQGWCATRLARQIIRPPFGRFFDTHPVNPDAKAPALDAPTLDHVVPVRSGGDDSSDNLRTAHFHCNCVKGAKPLQAVA